ncbi:hypothetical protein R9C00_08295 [Flammeovirgaceae bacterium SG7u.111]|nr:hypothetical protein [Flammeovirgaceae bacterium SG7u.132]WPO37447.1 hypothetical protein R9C00_08295 [Flammeovirgaceae bacterium SG7u.111]
MIKIVRYSFLSLLALLFALSSCEDESTQRIPDINANVGAITKIQLNPDKTFYNAFNNLATEEVEFDIDVDGFDLTEVETVDVELIFTEKDGTTDPEGNPADLTYPAVFLKAVTSFPSTVSITGQECADALDLDLADFKVGDGFNVMFPIHTKDGRKLQVALNSDLCQEPVQPSFGGCNVQWSISCPSDKDKIEGTYVAVTSGTSTDTDPLTKPTAVDVTKEVTITEVSPGVYEVSDILTGVYEYWYGDSYGYSGDVARTFTDVCGDLSFSFTEPYGTDLIGTGTIDLDKGEITWSWSNGYGDEASAVLTKK